jgi:hypothetical protein
MVESWRFNFIFINTYRLCKYFKTCVPMHCEKENIRSVFELDKVVTELGFNCIRNKNRIILIYMLCPVWMGLFIRIRHANLYDIVLASGQNYL